MAEEQEMAGYSGIGLSRVDPPRSRGPIAPDAQTDHQHALRERSEEADGFFRRLMNQHLIGQPMDMEQQVTDISILQLFDRRHEDGKARHISTRLKDSYQYGQELYRKTDRAVAWLFGLRRERDPDALDVGKYDLGHQARRGEEEIERGKVERMARSEMGGARGPGVRVRVNWPDTANMVEGPEKPKLLRGPVTREIAQPPSRRALPAPPRQITDQRDESDQAKKGRNAARRNMKDITPKGKDKGRGDDAR